MSQQLDDKIDFWINGFDRLKTREAIRSSVHAWNRYLESNNIDEYALIQKMKQEDEDQKYHELNHFVRSLNLAPASIRQYQNFVRAYLRNVFGIKTTHEDFRQIVKLPKIVKVNREPLTKEIIGQLVKQSDKVRGAWYLVLATSGMRASESLSLTEEDFDLSTKPASIFISGQNTKTQTDRLTFITKEAVKFLDAAGSEFWEPRKLLQEEKYFSRKRQQLGLTAKYQNSRNYKVNIHAFRAFFRTIAGEYNQDFAEHLIGHGYLKQYVRPTLQKLSEQYLQIEKNLKIF